jgi:hypothetical protein
MSSGGSLTPLPEGLSLLGMHEYLIRDKTTDSCIPAIGSLCTGTKITILKRASASVREHSRTTAFKELLLSPLTIPLRAIQSISGSIFNIITLGNVSVRRHRVEDSFAGRAKSMGCSLLSIATTPLNMIVEGASRIGHVINPTTHKVDLLAEHMWSGFVTAKREIK